MRRREAAFQMLKEGRVCEVFRGDVERDAQLAPREQIAQFVGDTLRHKARNLPHKAALLGQSHKDIRPHIRPIFVHPPHQRFGAYDFSCLQVDDRLIHHRQRPLVNGAAQLLFHRALPQIKLHQDQAQCAAQQRAADEKTHEQRPASRQHGRARLGYNDAQHAVAGALRLVENPIALHVAAGQHFCVAERHRVSERRQKPLAFAIVEQPAE